ncbi:uncharacterized protein ColSpa_10860 [Colletotrichum spaethianum]|uniref:Uncharacterized protein n=1 Tax=Colletotrichum spaethianum TaxID=700344 RepID=A0AA37PEE2_9PEZI|nr:uncharacterized protein ColSpa_10860 [Colletotrichum spaethianum]GKT50679.1 hypothetical protein ColSpa_10860 [Colletotrichum spaethianum]
MPLSRKLPALLALSASVGVLLSSILALAFKMVSYTSYTQETNGSPTGAGTRSSPIKGSGGWINFYPEHLVPVTRAPLVVAASFGLVMGLAATCLIAWSLIKKRVLPIAVTHQIALLAVLAVNVLVATVTMIYMLVQHSRSAHFDPEYEMTTAYYDHGLFTLETWACESSQYVDAFRDSENHSLVQQCTTERASRGLAVALFFFCLALLGLLAWDLNRTQVVVAKKQRRTKNSWEDDEWGY